MFGDVDHEVKAVSNSVSGVSGKATIGPRNWMALNPKYVNFVGQR